MLSGVPRRSYGGCLTCKNRKKKCDETRPVCRRCLSGNFKCLGYEDWISSHTPLGETPGNPRVDRAQAIMRVEPIVAFTSTSENSLAQRSNVPRPIVLNDVYSLIFTHYPRLAPRSIFAPFRFLIQDTIAQEVSGSRTELWTYFLGAKIIRALLDDRDEQHGELVEQFHERVRAIQTHEVNGAVDLEKRLSCLQNLAGYSMMTTNSQVGYRLFKLTTPIFLQLASMYPHIWSGQNLPSISVHRTLLSSPHYHLRRFVFWDTIASTAFASPTFLKYDTTRGIGAHTAGPEVLEWVYGCPTDMTLILARINSARENGWVGGVRGQEWRELESEVWMWKPRLDYFNLSDAAGRVMRLAVQEGWRHAMLVYLYMGMCGLNSADPRVEEAVTQIVKLAESVVSGNVLENHLFLPCLIAGVAACQETHRSIIRRKLIISKNENIWCLRGADFVPVLDRLWHGPGRDGREVEWEDYARCRREVLTIDWE